MISIAPGVAVRGPSIGPAAVPAVRREKAAGRSWHARASSPRIQPVHQTRVIPCVRGHPDPIHAFRGRTSSTGGPAGGFMDTRYFFSVFQLPGPSGPATAAPNPLPRRHLPPAAAEGRCRRHEPGDAKNTLNRRPRPQWTPGFSDGNPGRASGQGGATRGGEGRRERIIRRDSRRNRETPRAGPRATDDRGWQCLRLETAGPRG
jgi:hypothetical protein